MYINKKEGNGLGWEGRNTSYEEVQRTSPDNGQTYTVYNRTGGSPDIWLDNPFGYAQDYDGVIVALNKRYSNKWMMNASVSWSHSTGLNMRSHDTSQQNIVANSGGFGRDPNDLINATGDLQHDKRWVAKFTGGFDLPWELFFSGYFTWQEGRPRPAMVRVLDLEQGRREILADPRGDTRYPSFYTLNLRLQRNFALGNTWALKVMLDLFNSTNDDTFRSWRSNNMWRDTFYEESGLPEPRSLQLGLSLTF